MQLSNDELTRKQEFDAEKHLSDGTPARAVRKRAETECGQPGEIA
jgi:hypothetical protein